MKTRTCRLFTPLMNPWWLITGIWERNVSRPCLSFLLVMLFDSDLGRRCWACETWAENLKTIYVDDDSSENVREDWTNIGSNLTNQLIRLCWSYNQDTWGKKANACVSLGFVIDSNDILQDTNKESPSIYRTVVTFWICRHRMDTWSVTVKQRFFRSHHIFLSNSNRIGEWIVETITLEYLLHIHIKSRSPPHYVRKERSNQD